MSKLSSTSFKISLCVSCLVLLSFSSFSKYLFWQLELCWNKAWKESSGLWILPEALSLGQITNQIWYESTFFKFKKSIIFWILGGLLFVSFIISNHFFTKNLFSSTRGTQSATVQIATIGKK